MKNIDWRIVGVFVFVGVVAMGGMYLSKGQEMFERVGGFRNFIILEALMVAAVAIWTARRPH